MALPVDIRRYKTTDLNAVWVIWHTALGNLKPDQVPPIESYQGGDADLLNIDHYYLEGDGEFLVGIYHERVIALIGLKKSAIDKGEIRHMSVHLDYQRQGVGQSMMRAIEERAIEVGCKILHLDTGISQLPAQKLYLKCGFKEVGHVFVGSGNWKIILYEKNLESSIAF